MEKPITDSEYPSIRYVEAFPIETNNAHLIGLRDPNGIATDMLVLSPDLFYLLQFFDGKHSYLDLRYEYMRAFGNFLKEDQLTQILHNLDAHLFLDNENFKKRLKSIEEDFNALAIRPAMHAGQSYESEPDKLREQIAGFFKNPRGAGLPQPNTQNKSIKGLIAPHIDLKAGGPCYSYAYKALAESTGAECFVILGTGHAGLVNFYSMLAKDFATPFGCVKCDLDFINLFQSNASENFFTEILPHKREHTIEFQLVFLQYLYQNKRDFTFVPILCSFSHQVLNRARFPDERQKIDHFISALKKTVSQFGKRVCLIASVDLSHVGRRYGDQHAPDATFMANVHQADQNLLAEIENLDGEGFYRCLAKNQDPYRVCGVSSIYTLLKVVEAQKGKLLNYSELAVDRQNSTVTFASMVLE